MYVRIARSAQERKKATTATKNCVLCLVLHARAHFLIWYLKICSCNSVRHTRTHTHTPDRSVMQDLHVLPLDFRHQTFWWTHKALAYDNVMHSYSIYLRVNFTSIFLSFNFIPSEHNILLSSVLTAYCSLVCNDAICFVQFCRKTHFNRSRHSLHFSQSSIVVGSIRHVAIEMEII